MRVGVPVHDINVQRVSPSLHKGVALLGQRSEIAGEDGGGDVGLEMVHYMSYKEPVPRCQGRRKETKVVVFIRERVYKCAQGITGYN